MPQDGNGEEATEFHRVPLVDAGAQPQPPDLQVSCLAAEPVSSGGYVVLTLRLWSTGSLGTVNERDVEIALSPRAAAILCAETRRALKSCLLDPLSD